MSLTGHCGAAVGAAHCASLSEVSRLSSRRRCAVSGPRTSTTGASDIRMPPPQVQEQEYPERWRVFASLRLPYWVMPGKPAASFSRTRGQQRRDGRDVGEQRVSG